MSDFDWGFFDAALFDLDGVITPTAEVHMAAWDQMFNDYLSERHPAVDRYTEQDYFEYVDGRPRFDGVRTFLAARNIELPEGDPDDSPETETIAGLGNRKNEAFNKVLAEQGVRGYSGSIQLLDHLAGLGMKLAVVSSSQNAPAVLAAAGLADRFETVVDGAVAKELDLPGKPSPDTFLEAARQLGVQPHTAVVLEDAVSGVRAGVAGEFGSVVGVDRGAGDALVRAGADVLVSDLAELTS